MPTVTNISTYKFAPLTDLKPLRARLLELCKGWRLKGTILLSTEGINLFVAGDEASIHNLLAELRQIPGLETLTPKISESDDQPFTRMLVRIKKEIISMGVEGIDPAQNPSPKLSAKELKQWLDEGRPVTLYDTRNDYEIKLGTFKNALPAGIDTFRQFPAAVAKLPAEMKKQPIVMFCTGGIRCEKAGPLMEREGFEKIYQLDGGILKYFEECGGQHYDGECFVFDQRVGLDPSLSETDNTQCFRCQTPLTVEDQEDSRYEPGVSCPYCFQSQQQKMSAAIEARQAQLKALTTPLPGSVPCNNYRPVTVPEHLAGQALVDFLCAIFPHVAREHWQAECDSGKMLNEQYQPLAASHITQPGARYLHLHVDDVEPDVNFDVQVLHEDSAMIVLNKPAPLPVHPSGRFHRNTLQSLLRMAYEPQSPRPTHRLDANTTGLVVFARTRHFAKMIQQQFAAGKVEKLYLAKVIGHPAEDRFICDAPIGTEAVELGSRDVDFENGQAAKTEFEVVRRNADGTSLLQVVPITGRTNQIRVHLWQLGFPIVGDPTYLPNQQRGDTQTQGTEDAPLCLHAWQITLDHPLKKQRITFVAPRPQWAE